MIQCRFLFILEWGARVTRRPQTSNVDCLKARKSRSRDLGDPSKLGTRINFPRTSSPITTITRVRNDKRMA